MVVLTGVLRHGPSSVVGHDPYDFLDKDYACRADHPRHGLLEALVCADDDEGRSSLLPLEMIVRGCVESA